MIHHSLADGALIDLSGETTQNWFICIRYQPALSPRAVPHIRQGECPARGSFTRIVQHSP